MREKDKYIHTDGFNSLVLFFFCYWFFGLFDVDMPSFHYNDFLTFRRHRVQAASSSSSPNDPMNHSSSIVKNRRATLISIPPTLINISNQEILTHIRVQPTLFYYNEETFQEVCYRSIEDIRKINHDECLWIDVTGVRNRNRRRRRIA